MREEHVLPTADLIVHDETEDCPCGPRVTFVTGGKVVTHNSLDGREQEERDAQSMTVGLKDIVLTDYICPWCGEEGRWLDTGREKLCPNPDCPGAGPQAPYMVRRSEVWPPEAVRGLQKLAVVLATLAEEREDFEDPTVPPNDPPPSQPTEMEEM